MVAGLALAAAGCASSGEPATSRVAATANAAAIQGVGSAPTPVFAKTVRLEPVGGTVLLRAPGARDFTELTSTKTVPIGTVIDTRNGTVRLTSATAPPTKLQTGAFFLGRFQVLQRRSLKGLTDLVIRDKLKRSVCNVQGQQATAAKLSARILGLLRGNAKGRFRTRGRYAAATVRGTNWGVRDRCDGTLTVVRRGVVAVSDFTLHKTVIVRTGQSYLAKAG